MKFPHWSLSFLVALLFAVTVCPSGAEARPSSNIRADAQVAYCIRKATDGKSWLERTLWGLRDQEAGWIGAEVKNANGSHDLGPLQVNTWWVPRIARPVGQSERQIRLWLRDDACFNVDAARGYF